MKLLKKSLACILSVMLLLSCIPLSAAAAPLGSGSSVRVDTVSGGLEVTVDALDASNTLADAFDYAVTEANNAPGSSAGYTDASIVKLTVNNSTSLSQADLDTLWYSSTVSGGAAGSETDYTGLEVLDLSGAVLPTTAIPDHQFDGSAASSLVPALKEVILPASVTSIGANAFNGCTNLESVNFSDLTGLTTIGANAFEGASFEIVDLSGTALTNIGTEAFLDNLSLKSVDLSNLSSGSLAIGSKAFALTTASTGSLTMVDLTGSPVATVAAADVFNNYTGNAVKVVIEYTNLTAYNTVSSAAWATMTTTTTGSATFTYMSAPQNVTATGTADETVTVTWDAANYIDPSFTDVYYQIDVTDGTNTLSKAVPVVSGQSSYTYDVSDIINSLTNYEVYSVEVSVLARVGTTNLYGPAAAPAHDDYEDEVLVVPTEAETVDITTDLTLSDTGYEQNDTSTTATIPTVTIDEPANLVASATPASIGSLPAGTLMAADYGEVSYQWYYDTTGNCDPAAATALTGSDLAGTAYSGTLTNATFATGIPQIIPDVTLAVGTYYYFVVITNTNPLAYDTTAQTSTTVSAYEKVRIQDPNASAAPVITLDPVSASYVLNDTSAPLTAAATSPDGGTITYYWYYAENSLSAGGFTSTSTSSDTYTTPTFGGPATDKYGTFYYYAEVGNNNPLATGITYRSTQIATILVTPEHPAITGPADANYAIGDTVQPLTATATVSDGGTLTYQWYYNTTNSTTGGTAISGATSDSYTPDATITDAAGEYYYYVEVTNTNTESTNSTTGTYTETSAVARVTVGGVDAETPVLGSVTDGKAVEGTTGTVLTAPEVTGITSSTSTLSYQWYSCDDAAGTNPVAIPGANSATYEPDTTTVGTYYYYVAVSNTDSDPTYNGLNPVTENSEVYTFEVVAPLTDAETPVISVDPASASYVTDDIAADLSVTVDPLTSPTASLSYQWYRCEDATGAGATPITGETNATFAHGTSMPGTFYYFVRVTNNDSTATNTTTASADSKVATITVTDPATLVDAETPNITATNPADATYTEGDTTVADLTVEASVTTGTLTYQWYSCTDATGAGATPITGANTKDYTPDVSTAGTFYYFVEVTNTDTTATGSQTATNNSRVATITVNDPNATNAEAPVITTQPESAAYEVNASTVTPLKVEIEPVSGTASYQWYSCDEDGTNAVAITGATGSSYTPDVTTAGSYHYFVEVTNTDNSMTGNKTASTKSDVATVNVASEFTVTFMDGDDVLTDLTETVPVNGTVTEPTEDPEKEGYAFTGWYTDAECTEAYDFDAPVISDLTLYAGWEEMEDHFAYAAGYEDGTFGPNNNITRKEAAQLFHNLMRNPDPSTVEGTYTGYSDVNDNGWYGKAVQTLSKMGVIKGDDGATTFRPDDYITRAEFASMIQLFYDLDDGTTTSFPDIKDHWAWTAITALEEAGYTVGDTAGNYNPNANITRAEAVTMLNKAEGRFTSDELWVESGIESPFTDVTSPDDHWGYSQIMEAGYDHWHWYATEEAAE